jgi:uncharacterized protein (TIGR03435 family)
MRHRRGAPSRKGTFPTGVLGLAGLGVAIVLGGIMASGLIAQAKSPQVPQWQRDAGGKMAFDVASVKENKSGLSSNRPSSNIPLDPQNLYAPTGGLFSATNFPLLEYVMFAYKLTPEQTRALQSQVSWVNTNRWDIEGRASGNPSKDQMRLMMQALLADRFKLKLHFETQQLPVFALGLDKSGNVGPQLRQHVDDPPCSAAPAPTFSPTGFQATIAGGFPDRCGAFLPLQPSAPGEFRAGARDVPMAVIAMVFSSPLTGVDRPILDNTGLRGNFDLVIEFTRQPNRPSPPDATTSQPADTGPTFLEALKDQLGLKLDSATGPVETLVIDNIEQPSPN